MSLGILAWMLGPSLFAADDPFAGTWKLNAAKSKLPAHSLESDTLQIEVDGKSLKIAQDGVDDSGAPFKLTVLGGFDDSFYGIKGFAVADEVSFRRPSSRHILAEVKKSGATVAWIDADVSGNNLKINLSIVDAAGKESKSMALFQREVGDSGQSFSIKHQ
jgi:hypothetical protein